VCEEARPLTDLGHVGSIVFGILLALVAIWSLLRARVRPGWFMPAVAAALVVGTVVSLANTPIT
jgi:NO-binding membrane sensor protein with MHYT domain